MSTGAVGRMCWGWGVVTRGSEAEATPGSKQVTPERPTRGLICTWKLILQNLLMGGSRDMGTPDRRWARKSLPALSTYLYGGSFVVN